jgi:hypothetical protein
MKGGSQKLPWNCQGAMVFMFQRALFTWRSFNDEKDITQTKM